MKISVTALCAAAASSSFQGSCDSAEWPWECGAEVLQCCTTTGTVKTACCSETVGWRVGTPCHGDAADICVCSEFYWIADGVCNSSPDAPTNAPTPVPPTPAPTPIAPTAPASAALQALDKVSAKVSWTAATDTAGSPVTYYFVQLSKSNAFPSEGLLLRNVSAAAALEETYLGLDTGSTYYARVHATNNVGPGPHTTTTPASVLLAAAPERPATVTPTLLSSDSVSITAASVLCGTPASDPCNGLAVTKAEFSWSTSAAFTGAASQRVTVSDATHPDSYVHTTVGLTKNVAYYFRTRVKNAEGWSGWRAAAAAVTTGGAGQTADFFVESCAEAKLLNANSQSGVYWVKGNAAASFPVYCDMETDAGGWALAVKLKDASAASDNHPLQKFSGARWYSNDTGLASITVPSTPAQSMAASRPFVLLPFAQDDTFWGSQDAGAFAFTELRLVFGLSDASMGLGADYYLFTAATAALTAFPQTRAELGTCVKRVLGGVTEACQSLDKLYYMGNNAASSDAMSPSTAWCGADSGSSLQTQSQSLCLSTFVDNLNSNYNFGSVTVDSAVMETCSPSAAGCTGNVPGRRWEIWVR